MISPRNPFLNPEHPFSGSVTPKSAYEEYLQEEKRKNLEAKVNGNGRKKVKARKPEEDDGEEDVVQVINSNVSLDKLVVEAKSPRDGSDKECFYFNDSLAGLRSKGRSYARHLRPAEAMTILIDVLENKAKSKYKFLAKDMRSSYGEWLSAAFKRNGDNLLVYLDPENVKWNGSVYVVDGNRGRLKHSGELKFSIVGIPSAEYVDLKEFPTKFVELMYGRKFSDLPRAMRQGNSKAQVYLPQDEVLWPVGRGDDYSDYDLDADCGVRASRGVRP